MREDEAKTKWCPLYRNEVSSKLIRCEVGAGPKACFCVGPQNGEPLCPCFMVGVKIKNGRYVQPEQDLGPVNPKEELK